MKTFAQFLKEANSLRWPSNYASRNPTPKKVALQGLQSDMPHMGTQIQDRRTALQQEYAELSQRLKEIEAEIIKLDNIGKHSDEMY